MPVAMTGVPASSASCALLGGGDHRAKFSFLPLRLLLQTGSRFSTVWRSARIISVWIVRDVVGQVDLAVDVVTSLVAEDPRHLADRGGLADVREELVAQALALRRARDDAGDVDELHRRRRDPRRPEQLRQPRQNSSGTPTTPTFARSSRTGSSPRTSFLVSALKSVDLPALGSPTMPMGEPRAAESTARWDGPPNHREPLAPEHRSGCDPR